ncbi:hypothetical protein TSTA_048980 [Talaromyces stipitatus ATCC 10500]|uniref:Uncharacterized protein n=1 Tax=Talaromyces stipitatus (strain ATCC 10500 / CBS 375.48 / QM 6759 / NRRL 1006) TaxID=441959 RepID=B8ML42_TALSN|nr:uncharacterized protein TSTA_048980 [Talaromyces stipitatus ATCC 10500]EED15458.1 hypothetical protein TSTA_048980 [Talaromyces stipitatus ATCC 10500]
MENRWNSTYRMLGDGLEAKAQIQSIHSGWERPFQIHRILTKFNELTLLVSKRRPQISLAIPVYFELHDLLSEGSESQGCFKELDPDIAFALEKGSKKYMKYYTFMDESEIYYAALILDPKVKGDLILKVLEGKEAGDLILQATRDRLYQNTHLQITPDLTHTNVESRMLQRLEPESIITCYI